MLLLTRRPMVFLLGIGSYPVTAASVLRPCRDGFGRGRVDLEANPRNSSCPPRAGRAAGWGRTGCVGPTGHGSACPRRGDGGEREPAGIVAGWVAASGGRPSAPVDPSVRAALPPGDGTAPGTGRRKDASDHERAAVHHR